MLLLGATAAVAAAVAVASAVASADVVIPSYGPGCSCCFFICCL
jgi:hypothetical protein